MPVEHARFDRAVLGVIPFEVGGINDDSPKDSRQPQPDDAPVESGRSPPARLPAVHPFSDIGVLTFDEDGFAGLQQVFFWGKNSSFAAETAPAQRSAARTVNSVNSIRGFLG